MPAESRTELLQWFNSVLPDSLLQCIGGELTRIEQCGSGIPYLFVLPKLFPQSQAAVTAPSKAKLPARQEYESCCNLKILQDVFARNHVEPRCLELDRMAKRNFQANLEFLQWFKHLCDVRGVQPDSQLLTAGRGDSDIVTSGGDVPEAAAVGAPPRVNSNPPSPGSGAPRKVPSASSVLTQSAIRPPGRIAIPAAAGQSPQPSSRSAGVASNASTGLTGVVRNAASIAAAGPSGAPNSAWGRISPVRRSKSPVSMLSPYSSAAGASHAVGRSVTPTAINRPTSRSGSSSRLMSTASATGHAAASASASADQALLSTVDLERRFYYDKLRRIEDLIRQIPSSSSNAALASQVQAILYATS